MDNLAFIEDPGVNRLLDRLQEGMRIKSRIVFVLDDNRYLLRIHGYNLIMQSKLKFERLEEIMIEVYKTKPKLKLRLLKASGKNKDNSNTDIIA